MKRVSKKQRKSSSLIFVKNIIVFVILAFLLSCDNNTEPIFIETCGYDNFIGEYIFFSEMDTSSNKIEIDFFEENIFRTRGISGYGFWFPSASMSGEIIDCQIILDTYQNVEREGLSTPGGTPRYYYESMSGSGEYFPLSDSIRLFITYERTGDFEEYFNDEIYLVRDE